MSETIEKTFPVSSPARLNLGNIRGSVEIHPGEDGLIKVTASKDTGSGDAGRTAIEMTQEADGTVKVSTRFPEGFWSWLWGSIPCKVNYAVQVPAKCSLTVKSVSGDIQAGGFAGGFNFQAVSGGVTVQNLNGPVKIKTVSGDIELSDLTGTLDLNSVSGKVEGKRVNGEARLKTVSGKVTLDESSLPSIEASTVSGGMRFQTALTAGPYRFNAVSGEVALQVPPETKCTLEMRAVSGKILTSLPTTSLSKLDGGQVAQIQGGGVNVSLQSVSGNLALNS